MQNGTLLILNSARFIACLITHRTNPIPYRTVYEVVSSNLKGWQSTFGEELVSPNTEPKYLGILLTSQYRMFDCVPCCSIITCSVCALPTSLAECRCYDCAHVFHKFHLESSPARSYKRFSVAHCFAWSDNWTYRPPSSEAIHLLPRFDSEIFSGSNKSGFTRCSPI
jgi:hypothetical protein